MLIHARWVDKVFDYKAVSGRVLHCDIRIGRYTYRWIAVYELRNLRYPW